MGRLKELEAKVRELPLCDRLVHIQRMIGEMCSEGRTPKMSIPVQWDDEDFFISTTITDALKIYCAADGNALVTKQQIAEWRSLRGRGLVSAVGEYTPDEFWAALDEIDRLREEVLVLRTSSPGPGDIL